MNDPISVNEIVELEYPIETEERLLASRKRLRNAAITLKSLLIKEKLKEFPDLLDNRNNDLDVDLVKSRNLFMDSGIARLETDLQCIIQDQKKEVSADASTNSEFDKNTSHESIIPMNKPFASCYRVENDSGGESADEDYGSADWLRHQGIKTLSDGLSFPVDSSTAFEIAEMNLRNSSTHNLKITGKGNVNS